MKTLNYCSRLLLFNILFFASSVSLSAQYSWSPIAAFGGSARLGSSFFSLNDKGYVCLGYDGAGKSDCWEYNETSNSWTQKANYPGSSGWAAACFSFDSVGYVVSGAMSPGYANTVYQYNALSDTWSQKSNFPGTPRQDVFGFSIGNSGYVVGGWSSGYLGDLWEYNSTNDTWTQKVNFPGGARSGLIGFVINGIAYVGLGLDAGGVHSDFYAYDPIANSWTPKSSFPGSARAASTGFSLNGKGFVGVGTNNVSSVYNDFYTYDPVADSWTQIASIPSGNLAYAANFVIDNNAFLGTGVDASNIYKTDFFKLSCSSTSVLNLAVCDNYTSPSGNYTWTVSGTYLDTIPNSFGCDSIITINLTINNSTTAVQTDTSCNSYTSPSGNYVWTASGTYLDTISNAVGCDSVITINLTIINVDTSITQNGVTLTANTAGGTYQWLDCNSSYAIISGETNQNFTATINGNYAVAITENGCTDTSSCYTVIGVGLSEIISANNVDLFPNPVTNEFTVSSLESSFNKIELYNLLGEKVLEKTCVVKINEEKINVEHLPAGIYFLKVFTESASGGGVVTKKLLIE